MANVKDIVKDFYTVEDAMAFDEKTVKELQHKHLNKVRNQLSDSFFFTKAEGSKFWDEAGNVHLDFNTGVGVTTVGSNNPFVWEKIKKVVESKQHIIGAIMYHNVAAAFAHDMGLLSPGGKLTKMGTATGGAEAIEGCIKLVKIASRNKKDKTRILACENAFHGKTTGAVSVGGKEQWRKFQHPLMECVDHIPFGDAEALEKALATGQYKAFFVEPIQGEAGVKTPPKGYLKKVRELCTKYDAYMVADEIQCGCGRSGKMWVCQHEDVIPDVIAFAKGFSGGIVPTGGYITTEELFEAAYDSPETCFHHSATYQENALCAAAGLATLQYILENNLIENAAKMGDYFIGRLNDLWKKYPEIIKEVRGMGLMIGLETFALPEKCQGEMGTYYAEAINHDCVMKYHVQFSHTFNNAAVFRFLPPLTVTKDEIDYAMDSLEKTTADIAEKTA
ncbi:MAG: aminotransferase class III-fold pyridoxal phosphate-dependent enzyme [Clostridiales Family XIII bacterium]|jgi:putrescine aminotransferase|nr:aminotransferase class III-fold pyridoxal phosphate-dependent enzyme [Clostridiales Family XIII bacterium]